MPPNMPPGPPVVRDIPRTMRRYGSANCFRCFARSKSSVAGCSRRSDASARARRQEVLADLQRPAVLEAFDLDLRVVGAGRVDHKGAEPEAALDRALRDVDVLDARPWHVDHDPPMHALADL